MVTEPTDSPKVFISYSHDDDAHRERVLALSERLRADGVEACLDQYENGAPQQGWPRWMLDQLDWAEYVIIACTENYYRRFRGHEQLGHGAGVDWEGALITQELYGSRSRTAKFIPVVFDERDHAFVPEPLRSRSVYMLTSQSQYDQLYAVLLGRAAVKAGTVGELSTGSRPRGQPLSFVADREKHLESYRRIVAGRATLEVPGTSFRRNVADVYIWPETYEWNRALRPDFDEEAPSYNRGLRPAGIDLTDFPSGSTSRLVVVAPAGYGKTSLVRALSEKLLERALLPVIVSIPKLAALEPEVSLVEYLQVHFNRELGVAVDWAAALAAEEVVILLDGLDEVGGAARTAVMDRLQNFTLLHPGVSWLMTVRDAAALALPTSARLIALGPLQDWEVTRFIERYGADSFLEETLQRSGYVPRDLRALLRIPLFLAIAVTTIGSEQELPSTRTELLENYLRTLLNPRHFKPTQADPVDAVELRRIAEHVAFETLEREELLVSRRLVERTIRKCSSHGSVGSIMDAFVKCGLLVDAGATNLAFPFPTVPEYLAACHLVDLHAGEISQRFELSARRPWAQALQFALEKLDTADVVIEQLLSLEDDAFHTHLRLVALAIANGARVRSETRDGVVRRLLQLWTTAPHFIRWRTAELLAQTSGTPPLPELRECLFQPELLEHGTHKILTYLDSPVLARDVLTALVAPEPPPTSLYLGDIAKVAGDDALRIFANRARVVGVTADALRAMAFLMRRFDLELSEEVKLEVALDDSLPPVIRLEAFRLTTPRPLDERARPLIEAGLATEGESSWTALKAAWDLADGTDLIRAALVNRDLSQEHRGALLDATTTSALVAGRGSFESRFTETLLAERLEEPLREHLLFFLAPRGVLQATMELLMRSVKSVEDACRVLEALHGWVQAEFLTVPVTYLRISNLPPDERARAACAGTRKKSYPVTEKPFGSDPREAPWRELLEEWAAAGGYTEIDALRIEFALTYLGDESAVAQFSNRVSELLAVDGGRNIEPSEFEFMRDVLFRFSVLGGRQPVSTLAQMMTNPRMSGWALQHVDEWPTREALDALLHAYSGYDAEAPQRIWILETLEKVALRVGVRIRLVDGLPIVE